MFKDNLLFNSLQECINQLSQSNIIAYPTESIFALGCDPDSEFAVAKILKVKRRPVEKGLILVASCISQLRSYVNFQKLSERHLDILHTRWPGHMTFLMPASPDTPPWLTGYRTTIAVRVSQHPIVRSLCQEFCRPIVSTSANVTGKKPCKSAYDVKYHFGKDIPVLYGTIGGYQNPSEICDIISGRLIRQG